uniref:phylloplanin-like n=1 Tax=Erigeron canadensis TaxID=72917 RepID=UPI001CB9692F|nr:phylloplanin-like [Erigeron canadensis]
MAMKSFILITLLVVVLVAPQAKAQSIVRINGTIFCSLNGASSIVNNVKIPTLPFPNAIVQLTIAGTPILPTVTTNLQGQFVLTVVQSLLTSTLTNILSLANVIVTTPLSACNSTLPANIFLQSVSPLQLLANVTVGGIHLGVGAFLPVQL